MDGSLVLDDGRRLAFSAYGDPRGEPVLYLHGGLSCRADARFADDECHRLGVCLVAPDRPGVGDSDPDPTRTLTAWVSDVRALATHLKAGPLPVVGWSAGGPYALACGAGAPDLFSHVVTVGGMAPVDDPSALAELGMRADRVLLPISERAPAVMALSLRAAARLPAGLAKRMLLAELRGSDRTVVGGLAAAEVAGWLRGAVRRTPWGTVRDYQLLHRDWGLDLAGITAAVTLVQGEQDRLVPVAHLRRLQSLLPQARTVLLPDAGHFLLRSHLADVLATALGRA